MKCLKLTIHKALLHVFVSESKIKSPIFKKEKFHQFKFDKIKNVLIMGGAGFMGANIASLLSRYNFDKIYINDLNSTKLHVIKI